MRSHPLALLLVATACQSTPAPDRQLPGPRPDVPRIAQLPAGTRLRAGLAAGTADTPVWRAAGILWREALRQSAHFDVVEPGNQQPGAVQVDLAIDDAAHALAAACRLPDGSQHTLAGAAFPDGDLPAAIDRLAWSARLALGEAAPAPLPVGAAVSTDIRAILDLEDGLDLLRDGGFGAAQRALLAARTRDGGSPAILEALANVAMLNGDPTQAERLCLEALGYTARLAPITQHRLARTLLLARSSLRPDDARRHDAELLELGRAGARERPHDPQCRLTMAIAHNLLGEFATARPLLEELAPRFPQQSLVAYHLGWACLGTGDSKAAAAHFEAAAVRLPMPWVTVPRALALRAAGQDDGLQVLLAQLVAEGDPATGHYVHDLRRMQAAHALLRGQPTAAVPILQADLDWLVAHPTALATRAGELAEQGEVLVRLGGAASLPPRLGAIQAQHPTTAVADACAYLSGLVQIAATQQRQERLEGQLGRGGESIWSLRLQAFAHEQRGELADLHATLARAARLSDSPLTKALLARSLQQMGKVAEAAALRTALRGELDTIHLRRRPMHPLLGPELAYAYLLE